MFGRRRAVQGAHGRRRVRGRQRERGRDGALGRVGRGERRGRVAGPGDKLQQVKCELLSREAKQFTGVEGSMWTTLELKAAVMMARKRRQQVV